MEGVGKEGVLFDSFSESNSKEGSMRAGNNMKPLLSVARLQACLEDVAAARASAPAESDKSPSDETHQQVSSRDASTSSGPDAKETPPVGRSVQDLYRESSGTLESASSYELRSETTFRGMRLPPRIVLLQCMSIQECLMQGVQCAWQ